MKTHLVNRDLAKYFPGLIYLACPYTHESTAVKEMKAKQITKIAYKLSKMGFRVFSPITHTHPMGQDDSKFWEFVDEPILIMSSYLWITKLEGWKESQGVQIEAHKARNMGTPIYSFSPNNLAFLNVTPTVLSIGMIQQFKFPLDWER